MFILSAAAELRSCQQIFIKHPSHARKPPCFYFLATKIKSGSSLHEAGSVSQGLSSCGRRAETPRGVGVLVLRPGTEPTSLHWSGFPTRGHQGSPWTDAKGADVDKESTPPLEAHRWGWQKLRGSLRRPPPKMVVSHLEERTGWGPDGGAPSSREGQRPGRKGTGVGMGSRGRAWGADLLGMDSLPWAEPAAETQAEWGHTISEQHESSRAILSKPRKSSRRSNR